MYKISFLVPTTDVEQVKNAMFKAGAGALGDYRHCAWQVLGEGQFIALPAAQPAVGEKDTLNKVAEYYVQMICVAEKIHAVIAALKQAHPYEEPVYDVVKIESL